jgi:hypothetical protein
VGALLWNNIIVMPGCEALYADGRVTFHNLWLSMGITAGTILGGGAVLFTRSAVRQPEGPTPAEQDADDTGGQSAAPREPDERGVTVPVSGPGQLPDSSDDAGEKAQQPGAAIPRPGSA